APPALFHGPRPRLPAQARPRVDLSPAGAAPLANDGARRPGPQRLAALAEQGFARAGPGAPTGGAVVAAAGVFPGPPGGARRHGHLAAVFAVLAAPLADCASSDRALGGRRRAPLQPGPPHRGRGHPPDHAPLVGGAIAA